MNPITLFPKNTVPVYLKRLKNEYKAFLNMTVHTMAVPCTIFPMALVSDSVEHWNVPM